MNRSRLAAFALAVLLGTPAAARIDLTLDTDALNGLLKAMAPDHVDVPLSGRTLTMQLKDLKVTGFDPDAGPNGGVMTSLRLVVPDLNLDVPVTPRLSLGSRDDGSGRRVPTLRFDRVMLGLPVMGPIDVAALLPTLQLIPDSGWVVDSARGPMRVVPTLLDAKTGAKNIRLGLDLDIRPAK